MLLRVTYPAVTIDQYLPLLSPQLVNDLTALAQEVGHLRFVHLNSTAVGGGVAEILQSLVPFMNALGVETERVVINPPPEFFQATKHIHNLLQGAEGSLSPEESETYYQAIQDVAQSIRQRCLKADVWFLHDPQLLPLGRFLTKEVGEVRLWVCHIDLTAPNRRVMESLLPLTQDYDGLIFSLDSYVPSGLDGQMPVYIVPPAIDPLTVKNIALAGDEALKIVAAMGIDPGRALISQVSRFDLWKDPWGVIEAYRHARRAVPGLQLALLGLSQASDDPEALEVLNSVTELAGGDPDIHLYFYATHLPADIDTIVNAFQVASTVVLQKSTREGFGLTVSEAMWKGGVVIGGNVGGIRLQIENGVTGFLVSSPEECALRIVQVMKDPELRDQIGAAAREAVRHSFLMPRLALDYLRAATGHLSVPPVPPSHLNANGHRINPFKDLDSFQEITADGFGAAQTPLQTNQPPSADSLRLC